jgi:hypothetical protein
VKFEFTLVEDGAIKLDLASSQIQLQSKDSMKELQGWNPLIDISSELCVLVVYIDA